MAITSSLAWQEGLRAEWLGIMVIEGNEISQRNHKTKLVSHYHISNGGRHLEAAETRGTHTCSEDATYMVLWLNTKEGFSH